VEDAPYDAYSDGRDDDYPSYSKSSEQTIAKVQQRLEYMQSQIDDLMLEYCPDEMSQEQLDNWAKNQVVSTYDPSGN